MKKVLVTGAAGFLGSHICERFLEEDFKVVGMDNFIKKFESLSGHGISKKALNNYINLKKFVH